MAKFNWMCPSDKAHLTNARTRTSTPWQNCQKVGWTCIWSRSVTYVPSPRSLCVYLVIEPSRAPQGRTKPHLHKPSSKTTVIDGSTIWPCLAKEDDQAQAKGGCSVITGSFGNGIWRCSSFFKKHLTSSLKYSKVYSMNPAKYFATHTHTHTHSVHRETFAF